MDTQLKFAFSEHFCFHAARPEFQLTLRHSGKQANNAYNGELCTAFQANLYQILQGENRN